MSNNDDRDECKLKQSKVTFSITSICQTKIRNQSQKFIAAGEIPCHKSNNDDRDEHKLKQSKVAYGITLICQTKVRNPQKFITGRVSLSHKYNNNEHDAYSINKLKLTELRTGLPRFARLRYVI